ncbi:MAG: hypothetical protein AAF251_05920 [Pseudomonadota bacterium]
MRTRNKAIAISTRAARGADITPTMPYVLASSLALAASTMSLAWIIPTLAG